MKSLFSVNFNWSFYLVTALVIRVIFYDMDWYIYTAIMIFIHQLLLLFSSMGSIIPVRYLLGTFMCLQMLLGPSFAYSGADEYHRAQYRMQIPMEQYFSYVIPAVICFILGLHITAKKLQGEIIDEDAIGDFIEENPYLAYYFIGFGFAFSVASQMVASELGFALMLLGNLKFIGAFLIILRKQQLQFLPLFIVFSSIILSSIFGAMFHDLLTWMLFIGAVLAIRFKPSVNFKLMITIGFIILAFTIQKLKGGYREETWYGNSEAGLETLEKVYNQQAEGGEFFSAQSFAQSNLRINQGFIVTHILKNVPTKVPFSRGEELGRILEAAFLPRILAPNKLNAGDRELFMYYSGMRLHRGTSMALSSVGDAYINFGVTGGWLFMFCYGLLFSTVLNKMFKASVNYPIILLFPSLMFYYPIRPDCELQTILGHLFKSAFVVYMIFLFFKRVSSQKKISLA